MARKRTRESQPEPITGDIRYDSDAYLTASQPIDPTLGTYGSLMMGALPGSDVDPGFIPPPIAFLDGSELNPLYDPSLPISDYAHHDLQKNDTEALNRLLQTRLSQIEMLKQFSINNNRAEIRSELHALQAQYERMASEIREMILIQGQQPDHSQDIPGRIQSLLHTWQSMTTASDEAVDLVLNTETEMLADEEEIIATMHRSESRDLAMRQLGEERQIFHKLQELAGHRHR